MKNCSLSNNDPLAHSLGVQQQSLTWSSTTITHLEFNNNHSLGVQQQSLTWSSTTITHLEFNNNHSLGVQQQSLTWSSTTITHLGVQQQSLTHSLVFSNLIFFNYLRL
jgi:hypothetical protein